LFEEKKAMKTRITLSVFSLIFLLISTGINAQDLRSVTGIVTSFQTIPLKNVKVMSVKAGESALTDSAGMFSIKCFNDDVLRVSASGFLEKRQKVKTEPVYKIDLIYNDNVKNFNDAVSHGHISEEVLRNALFAQESKTAKDYSKYKTIYELISSEIYNVRVKGNSIINTKVRSFDTTPEVLLVVDDKIVTDISYIDTHYVKSVEFVDDVGSSMYGSKGANGVIKIYLK
jgi:hypothetical protein